MARVTIEAIGKDIGDRTILDDVTLDVLHGEFFCVIGPSGCGKTMLLRILAGLERPDRGAIYFDGEDVTRVGPSKRDVAMVFQSYALYPHLRARGNIGFPLQITRVQADEIDRRVVKTAEELSSSLVEMLDRRPEELSMGFRQRVAVGRAMVRHPRVYLFDEPLSNLDAKISAQTRAHMRRLLRGLGSTVIYVTPDDREAFALADRIAVMSPGRIEQVSTPRGLWARPTNRFVAEFVHEGILNLYPAHLDRVAGRVETAAFSLPSIPEIAARIGRDDDFVLGLLPSQVRLDGPSELSPLVGRVELVEPLISERKKMVHVRREGFHCIAEVGYDVPVHRDEWVGVAFNLEHAMLFDAETGRTIT
jgi:multiple sugar transport system ATP-binding protein